MMKFPTYCINLLIAAGYVLCIIPVSFFVSHSIEDIFAFGFTEWLHNFGVGSNIGIFLQQVIVAIFGLGLILLGRRGKRYTKRARDADL
jgi:hypothetical protein